MPMRLHSFSGQSCLQGGGVGLGAKTGVATGLGLGPCGTGGGMAAVGGGGIACPQTGGALTAKGLGVKAGAGTGLGLGQNCIAGKTALGVKGATAVVWNTGSGAAAGHGISLGLGLGLGAWGPVLLGAGIIALGYHFYANRNLGRLSAPTAPTAPKDELAAVLNGSDI
jgi:hypothetical protein